MDPGAIERILALFVDHKRDHRKHGATPSDSVPASLSTQDSVPPVRVCVRLRAVFGAAAVFVTARGPRGCCGTVRKHCVCAM